MLMGNSAWDEISLRGNPTKSKEVNDCIKDVMKAEVRNQGVPMAARRAMEYKEFLNLLTIVRKKANTIGDEHETNTLKWSRLLALLTLQWQLIGQMDPMMISKSWSRGSLEHILSGRVLRLTALAVASQENMS